MQLKTTKTKNNGIDCFMVEFPPVNGKRQRQFFKTADEGDKGSCNNNFRLLGAIQTNRHALCGMDV